MAPRSAPRFAPPTGIDLYQDIVLAGQVVSRGTRDCAARWALIEPHLPRPAAVLEVGSNFGWFAQHVAATCPETVIASFEADERSAFVQHEVLASHSQHRVALLTRTFRATTLDRLAAHGQRFDAVLLLAILHWLPDAATVLERLHRMAGHVFIEHPADDEHGVGRAEAIDVLGPLGPALARALPGRTIARLGDVPGLRDGARRTLWHVGPPAGWQQAQQPSLEAAALLAEQPIWPPQSWWQRQLDHLPVAEQRRLVARVPERYRLTIQRRLYRAARRAAGGWVRRVRMSLRAA